MDGMSDYLPYLPWIGVVSGLLCLVAAFRQGRLRRLVENLPVSKTTGVFIGLVDLKGTAESAQPLTSYLAEQPCVQYQWSVEENWERIVTETYTDASGKTQTRTRTESGWKSIAGGDEMIPFFLRDDCGVILIRPEGAKLEPKTLCDETCGRRDPLYYGKGPQGAISDSTHRRRFVEQGIPQHAAICLIGQARERQDIVAAEIAQDPRAPMFLITTRSREQVSSGMKWGQWLWTLFGLILTVTFFVWRDVYLVPDLTARLPLYAAAAFGFLAVAVLVWVWMVYNSFVDLRQRVRQAWSLVDVQLQRRHDLIPNLVQLVQGYGDYEHRLQRELAALRSELVATPPGVAGPDYRAVTNTVVAIAEHYPQIKADANFMGLQKCLVDTEQRIALARGYFNDIATHYNTRLEIVPERFVARLAGMQPQALMGANDFERAAVNVDMSVDQPVPARAENMRQ
jgi:hypothetical protein